MPNQRKAAHYRQHPLIILGLATALLAAACVPRGVRRARALLDLGDHQAAAKEIARGLADDPDGQAWLAVELRLQVARDRRGAALAAYRKRPSDWLLRSLAESVLWWGLRHPDPKVRLEAIQAIRAVDAGTLEDAMTYRLDDPDELVRTWAAVALLGTPAGADTLERQLRSSAPRARATAVRELGRIAGKAALPTIKRYLTDRHPLVRAAAAQALARAGTLAALAPLRTLARDKDRDVRLAAVRALGRLAEPAAAKTLRLALADDDLAVRLAAASALGRSAGADARADLRRLALGKDPLLSLRAAVALAQVGAVQPALNAIARGLVDRNESVRIAALTAASSLSDPVAKRLARKATRDPQPRVRLAAARTLFSHQRTLALGVARSIHRLACRKAGGDLWSLCVDAADLLARAGVAAGHRTLARLARKDASPVVRLAALRWALLRAAPSDLARDALADRDPRVSLAAARWLYRQLR